jgi:hypothetical protein
LTIKNYSKFLFDLFNYYELEPPYIFITFSEGGFDVLCFSKYYNQLIKQIYFIDTPILGRYLDMFEKFRNNDKWMNDVRNKQFTWDPLKGNLLKGNVLKETQEQETLEKIDIYNFEIKTYNIINKLTMADLPTKIPVIIIWSPYFESPNKKSKEKTKILDTMSKELDNFTNIKYLYMDAPHQIERVLPITLSNFIISNLY